MASAFLRRSRPIAEGDLSLSATSRFASAESSPDMSLALFSFKLPLRLRRLPARRKSSRLAHVDLLSGFAVVVLLLIVSLIAPAVSDPRRLSQLLQAICQGSAQRLGATTT